MEKLLETVEKKELQYTVAYLYIRNFKLRVTYHLDDNHTSFGTDSDYYNSNEVVDTHNIYQFLNLDYRERDFSDMLVSKGYFLVGEMVDNMPDYMRKFVQDFGDKIRNKPPKIIKRTFGNKVLVYLKLKLPIEITPSIKRYGEQVQAILQNY